jgi:hypothetical protein
VHSQCCGDLTPSPYSLWERGDNKAAYGERGFSTAQRMEYAPS